MTDDKFKAEITFVGDQPMKINKIEENGLCKQELLNPDLYVAITKTLRAYISTCRDSITEKYQHLLKFIPNHLANMGNVLIVICNDGVVIRYDKKTESKSHLYCTEMQKDLPDVVSLLSQGIIYCDYPDKFNLNSISSGVNINIGLIRATESHREVLKAFNIKFNAVIVKPESRPTPPRKPFCLLSVQNSLELQLTVERIPESNNETPQLQVIRSKVPMPVGWDCLEVYSFIAIEDWNAEYAPLWADNDILAAIVSKQFEETQLNQLDPHSESRRKLTFLLKEFKTLLDSNPEREQVLQSFLQKNPFLLCPTQVQMWPKLSFGKRITDFVFREPSQDYLLVEIERSTLKLFIKSNGDTSADLNHAIGQIREWKRYIEDNLATVQRELGLENISANPRSLVVIGRSKDLSQENRRSLSSIHNEQPKLRIMTYDDVYENAKAVIENLYGYLSETSGKTEIT